MNIKNLTIDSLFLYEHLLSVISKDLSEMERNSWKPIEVFVCRKKSLCTKKYLVFWYTRIGIFTYFEK